MSRRAPWLAWSLGGLSVTMFFAGVAFTILSLLAGTDRPTATVGELVIFAPFLSFPIVGALIASRRPGNPIGWICLAAGITWMLARLSVAAPRLVWARSSRVE